MSARPRLNKSTITSAIRFEQFSLIFTIYIYLHLHLTQFVLHLSFEFEKCVPSSEWCLFFANLPINPTLHGLSLLPILYCY